MASRSSSPPIPSARMILGPRLEPGKFPSPMTISSPWPISSRAFNNSGLRQGGIFFSMVLLLVVSIFYILNVLSFCGVFIIKGFNVSAPNDFYPISKGPWGDARYEKESIRLGRAIQDDNSCDSILTKSSLIPLHPSPRPPC